MVKKAITQHASDNEYFHKDFHTALNYGIDYLYNNYGENAVVEYLSQFANNYHGPLKKSVCEKGLLAVHDHYKNIFEIESAKYDIKLSKNNNELTIHLHASPAVLHINESDRNVSPVYDKTISVVNEEICRNTPFACKLIEYNLNNGGYKLQFFKRAL